MKAAALVMAPRRNGRGPISETSPRARPPGTATARMGPLGAQHRRRSPVDLGYPPGGGNVSARIVYPSRGERVASSTSSGS